MLPMVCLLTWTIKMESAFRLPMLSLTNSKRGMGVGRKGSNWFAIILHWYSQTVAGRTKSCIAIVGNLEAGIEKSCVGFWLVQPSASKVSPFSLPCGASRKNCFMRFMRWPASAGVVRRRSSITSASLGLVSSEHFKRGSQNFTGLSWTISLTDLPDMTSLAACCRLWNTVIYCRKVRKNECGQQRI